MITDSISQAETSKFYDAIRIFLQNFYLVTRQRARRSSAVNTVTTLRVVRSGVSILTGQEISIVSKSSGPVLRLTQPPIQGVTWWFLYIHVTVHRNIFIFNNQPDALIIQIYSVIKFYMFRASSLPIIESSLLYIRHW